MANKHCPRCGVTKPLIDFGRYGAECKPCHAAVVREYRRLNPEVGRRQRHTYRDSPVYRARKAELYRNAYVKDSEGERLRAQRYAKTHRHVRNRIELTRKAIKLGVFKEVVDPAVIVVRDKGICGICLKAVPKSQVSVDHIVALSKGGEHSYANTQLAHRRCNSAKGTKTKGQLRLELNADGHAAGTLKVTSQELPVFGKDLPLLFQRFTVSDLMEKGS